MTWRRQQIVTAATDQFAAFGYHNVGMNQIAAALGVTGPSLYRHFSGKQLLLQASVEEVLEQVAAILDKPYDDLPAMIEALVDLFSERRHVGVLWQRESLHLDEDQRSRMRTRSEEATRPLREMIAQSRQALSPDDVDLLAWTVLGLLCSVAYTPDETDPSHRRQLLVGAAMAVLDSTHILCEAGPPVRPRATAPDSTGLLRPASRREAVLVAAVRLFASRGYQAVSIDDIGAAAGITGPSLYHHFPSKSGILVAELTRCLSAMMLDVDAALGHAESAAEALDMLVESAVRMTVVHGHVLAVLVNEIVNVPSEERQALRRAQLEYVAEWVALVAAARPGLDVHDASVVVYAALTAVEFVSRRPAFRSRPGFSRELRGLVHAMLGTGPRGEPLDAEEGADRRRA